MQKPLISVIIPVYNAEKYLHKCLDSVIDQTYKNLEIIIVDDGSTDKSAEICDEYARKDRRIKLIHKENGGVSSARNAGLSLVSGDYIAWVDSDDYVDSDYIEYMYQLLKEHDADISSCEKMVFSNLLEEKKIEAFVSDRNKSLSGLFLKSKESRVINNIKEIMIVYLSKTPFTISATFHGKLFKKSLFNNITIVGESFDDAYTFYKILVKCNKYVFGEEIKYFYRNLDSSISHLFNIRQLERIDAELKQKEYIDINFPELNNYNCADVIHVGNALLRGLIRNDNSSSILLNSTYENVKVVDVLSKIYKENLFQYLKYLNDPIRDKIFAVFAYISIPITVRIYKVRFHNDFWIRKIKKLVGIRSEM